MVTNHYNSEFTATEIDWKPMVGKDGGVIRSKDNTELVVTEAMVLTPSLQGQYGGWAFEGIDGFWSEPRGMQQGLLQPNVPVLVTLSLGGYKNNGTRYQNMNTVKAVAADAQSNVQSAQPGSAGATTPNAPGSPVTIDRDSSIREQAFYNHLNIEILDRLPLAQQNALLSAYFDTAMLMMRDVVRARAQKKLVEVSTDDIESPMVDAAKAAGGIVEKIAPLDQAETIEELQW